MSQKVKQELQHAKDISKGKKAPVSSKAPKTELSRQKKNMPSQESSEERSDEDSEEVSRK